MSAQRGSRDAGGGQLLLELTPSPEALISSLRDIGYSFQTAIADLIDNSITAKAHRIDIIALWNQDHPFVAIIDDGNGMDKDELCAAMRFGSTSPLEVRAAGDMGRFGLGLKTASISQCLKLQVLSKKDGGVWNAIWDLERICRNHESSWQIALESGLALSDVCLRELAEKHLEGRASGTIVFWTRMDRMEKDATNDSFNTTVANLRRHLGLTFHRLLHGGPHGLTITVNNRAVEPFDPFNARAKPSRRKPSLSTGRKSRLALSGSPTTARPPQRNMNGLAEQTATVVPKASTCTATNASSSAEPGSVSALAPN